MRAWTSTSLALLVSGCSFVSASPPPMRPAHSYAGGRMAQPAGYVRTEEPLQSERLLCYAQGPGQPGFPSRDRYVLRRQKPQADAWSYGGGRANQPYGFQVLEREEPATLDDDACVSRVVW